MKKNKMMRLASAMMVLTLMSTSVISGTFAKYVTSDSATDVARVAKWGVTVSASGTEETFDFQYATDDIELASDEKLAVGSMSVISSTNPDGSRSDVVAPGTVGTLGAIVLAGAPEVAVDVEYKADLKLEGWTLASTPELYFPIVITVGTKKYEIDSTYDTLDKLEDAVEAAIADYSGKYQANTPLNTVDAPSVTWEWPFSTGEANDIKDTELGDLAASGNASWITLKIIATVTQID